MDPRLSGNGNDDDTPPQGVGGVVKLLRDKADRHDSDIEALKTNARNAANGIAEVAGSLGELASDVQRIEKKVDDLTVDLRRATIRSPPLPPMRPELDSKIQLRPLAEEIKEAAIRGEKLDGTTPEAEVEKVIERVELLRLGRRTRAMLNKGLWLAVAGASTVIAEHIIAALAAHHP